MWILQQFSSTCCTCWVLWHKGFTAAFCSVVDVSQRFCSPHSGSTSWRASPGPGSHSDSSVLLCDPLPSGANRAGNSRMASNPPHLQLCRWEGVKRCAEASVPCSEGQGAVQGLPCGIPQWALKSFLVGNHLWSHNETIWCHLLLLKSQNETIWCHLPLLKIQNEIIWCHLSVNKSVLGALAVRWGLAPRGEEWGIIQWIKRNELLAALTPFWWYPSLCLSLFTPFVIFVRFF